MSGQAQSAAPVVAQDTQRPLRVLYVTQGYKPAFRLGGPIMSVSAMAETLVAKGHHVAVATTNSNLDQDIDVPLGRMTDVDGVPVVYFRRIEILSRVLPFLSTFAKARGFSYAPDLGRFLARHVGDYDLVHTQLPFTYPTYVASKHAHRAGRPHFYHQRGVFHPERLNFRAIKKRAYIGLVEKPILDRATTLIALTAEEVDSYRALGATQPCRVIPNGIEPGDYRRRPNAQALSLPDDAPVILFMGRVHPAKGADRLLEAFFILHERWPQARLVLAGPNEFGLEDAFRARVAERGLSEYIVFPGMMTGEAKLDLLARADVFALPSDGEGFSMAILEALASATPVLISPGCNFPEVAEAGAGRVVANDPVEMAAALDTLLADREALRAMGERGYELVRERYSWDTLADTLIEAYREGIARHAAQGHRR